MTDYVALEDLKNSLELQNQTFADADIRDAITAASRAVEAYCDRVFTSTGGTAEVRHYTAYETICLDIDDATTVTSLKSDFEGDGTYETTWTVNTEYVLQPANAPSTAEPYNKIEVLSLRTGKRFPLWPNGVEVTGQFGWATAPAEVKVAVKILAERFLRRVRDAPFGVITFGPDQTLVTVTQQDPDLKFLLDKYVSAGKVMAA